MYKQINNTFLSFITLIDGYEDYVPPIKKGLSTHKLGVCKLEVKDNKLHVYLRRPGLLIGSKGKTIQAIQEKLEMDIVVHEVTLLREGELD